MEKSQIKNTFVKCWNNSETRNWCVSHYGTGLWFFGWLSLWSWQLFSISRLAGCFIFPAMCHNHLLRMSLAWRWMITFITVYKRLLMLTAVVP